MEYRRRNNEDLKPISLTKKTYILSGIKCLPRTGKINVETHIDTTSWHFWISKILDKFQTFKLERKNHRHTHKVSNNNIRFIFPSAKCQKVKEEHFCWRILNFECKKMSWEFYFQAIFFWGGVGDENNRKTLLGKRHVITLCGLILYSSWPWHCGGMTWAW